jgi:hypothetical protein
MDKIGIVKKRPNSSQGAEKNDVGVTIAEKLPNRSGEPDKIEPPVTIIEKADEPGNWQSKIGISIPKSGKWNPFFHMPTIGHTGSVIWKLAKFYGPGAIVSVAYVDPDNYQTDIAVGAQFQYKMLFMVLVSNILAVYLQVGWILAESSGPLTWTGAIGKDWSHNWLDAGRDESLLPAQMAQHWPVDYC